MFQMIVVFLYTNPKFWYIMYEILLPINAEKKENIDGIIGSNIGVIYLQHGLLICNSNTLVFCIRQFVFFYKLCLLQTIISQSA